MGLELVLIWDAGVGDSSLGCCATVVAPVSLFVSFSLGMCSIVFFPSLCLPASPPLPCLMPVAALTWLSCHTCDAGASEAPMGLASFWILSPLVLAVP